MKKVKEQRSNKKQKGNTKMNNKIVIEQHTSKSNPAIYKKDYISWQVGFIPEIQYQFNI